MAFPEVIDRLFVGQGKVYYGDRDPATGKPIGGLNFLGNCPSLKFSLKSETIKHKDSTSGQRLIDKVVTVGQEGEATVAIESFTRPNLEQAMYGTSIEIAAGTATDEVAVAKLGRYVKLANMNLTALTSVKNQAGAITYVAGEDFEIDLEGGLLYFPESDTAIADGQILEVTYQYGAQEEIGAFSDTAKERYYLFVGLNQAEDDAPVTVEIPRLRLDPLDNWEMIGDQFNKLELKGMVLPDKKQPRAARYIKVRQTKQVA
jgi:hypothetical protein